MKWFDLSPMRPDEFMKQESYRWQYITECQAAYEAGRKRADEEAAAVRELEREDW